MLQVEEMGRENAELRTASQHNSLTVTETEPVSDMKQRPVSMYETRESVRAQVSTGRVVWNYFAFVPQVRPEHIMSIKKPTEFLK